MTKILLFDGYCNLCNGFVQFVIRKDSRSVFYYKFLNQNPESVTVVLIENHKVYTQSTAVLRVFRALSPPWKWLYALIIIPAFLRNPVYRFVARHRYRWFGKRSTCMIPDEAFKKCFMED